MSADVSSPPPGLGTPNVPAAPLLEVRDMAAQIGGRQVLSGVNLRLERGETVGLVGETGSGKTVTCRAVMGLLPRLGGAITDGEIVLKGRRLHTLSEREWHRLRGRVLALVPQSSLSGLDPVMTIGRQLRETIRLLDPDANTTARALELVEMVEMPRPAETLSRYSHELSGGMRQRVMIALAIAGRPELLVADEPTTALDVTVQAAILELINALRNRTAMSVIIVTHDLGVVEAVSDRVAIMYAGMTVETGPTRDVLSRPRHPYTVSLLAARPSARRAGERLEAIPGLPPSPEQWPIGCRFVPRCAFAQPCCDHAPPLLTGPPGMHAAACVRQQELFGD